MKRLNVSFRKIDWQKMAKARITVKNLAAKKSSLKYLADFLDEIAEIAIEEQGIKLSDVYPSANHIHLVNNLKNQKN